ncbi:MAG TPA: DUF3422 domain-containing protein [Xanthobacteraceae bacterium]|nr:DUF3422 domain-containing protein [Xanthobacteraceae bacterium]
MSAEITIGEGNGTSLIPHPLRAAVLGEVHARPFTAIETPRRVLHFAFDTSADRGEADRAALIDFCTRRGLAAPERGEKHHRVTFGGTALRWEQHSEFTTYTWELPSEAPSPGAVPFHPPASALATVMKIVPQPGPALVAIDLHLVSADGVAPERLFDRASLAVAENSDGTALYATDFQPDPAGFVRILVVDRGLGAERAGALVQRLLELETYRTLALLGLPEAQRLAPSVQRIETRLADVTEQMRGSQGLAANHHLLDELTALAAELEAGAAASLFRFGASRAYNEIVYLRLETIGERKVGGLPTWSSFLARRMAPAMRTCITMTERQGNLSRKLARAAQLLRTRVDIELEQQNRDLLRSMNERTRMQLRLQATVEGLSVAAISYYVVGLIGYVAKGAHDAGAPLEPTYVSAIAVPLVVVAIWYVVRRIRRRHVGRSID